MERDSCNKQDTSSIWNIKVKSPRMKLPESTLWVKIPRTLQQKSSYLVFDLGRVSFFNMFIQLFLSIIMIKAENYPLSVQPALVWNITAFTKSDKNLLKKVVGCANQGKLHAIMGPSGSGKTTLLNVLAGVVPKKSLSLYGYLQASNSLVNERVYVQQEDLLFSELSVLETLDTSSALRFPDESSKYKIDVDDLINELGLKKSKFTRVGSTKSKGISGGEKKRLSIGNEILGARNGRSSVLVFADEPTSGLDSFQAEKVVQILKSLAQQGNTVIVSIHQVILVPPSVSWNTLYLL